MTYFVSIIYAENSNMSVIYIKKKDILNYIYNFLLLHQSNLSEINLVTSSVDQVEFCWFSGDFMLNMFLGIKDK